MNGSLLNQFQTLQIQMIQLIQSAVLQTQVQAGRLDVRAVGHGCADTGYIRTRSWGWLCAGNDIIRIVEGDPVQDRCAQVPGLEGGDRCGNNIRLLFHDDRIGEVEIVIVE